MINNGNVKNLNYFSYRSARGGGMMRPDFLLHFYKRKLAKGMEAKKNKRFPLFASRALMAIGTFFFKLFFSP